MLPGNIKQINAVAGCSEMIDRFLSDKASIAARVLVLAE